VTDDSKHGRSEKRRVPVLVALSGQRRGHVETLDQDTLRIVAGAETGPEFLSPADERAKDFHATLRRDGDDYEIESAPDHELWVNGNLLSGCHKLRSGDLLEIGYEGPVVRYRLHSPNLPITKTFAEAVADSLDGARADGRSRLGRTSRFLGNVTHDLATQTTLWFRIWVLALLTLVAIGIAVLVIQNLRLQKRVAVEGTRIEALEEVLERRSAELMTQQDLLNLQGEVNTQLADAFARLQVLEEGTGTASRVIAKASPSVAFVLGAFGFVDPASGKTLRSFEITGGAKRFTFEEEGKPVQLAFTGTAFAVAESGLLLTNRHVAEPWIEDQRTEMVDGRELTPVIHQIVAYFPGKMQAINVELVRVSEHQDLALLHATGDTSDMRDIALLELDPRVPQPGDEVLVVGYAAGMRGLLARTSPEFIASITPDGPLDFWSVARLLAEGGHIKPLASRGIVSQVSEQVIVYDAETTIGGSGGPVLDRFGQVIAINAAVLPEFGGSNMGIPAAQAKSFLAEAGSGAHPDRADQR
jgi:serine protease Do